MSSFQIQRSQSSPQLTTPVSRPVPQPIQPQDQPVSEVHAPPLSRQNSSQVLQQHDPLQPGIVNQLDQGIQDAPPPLLRRNSSIIPQPQGLQDAHPLVIVPPNPSFLIAQGQIQDNATRVHGTQLQHLYTPEVHQLIEDLKPQVQTNYLQAQTSLSQTFADPSLQSGKIHGAFKTLMQTEISSTIRTMDRSLMKTASYNEASTKTLNFMANLSQTDEKTFVLICKSSEPELREALARQLGSVKDKYQGASYADLSESKQKMVNHMVATIRQLAQNPENQGAIQRMENQYLASVKTAIQGSVSGGNANSNLSLALNSMSSRDLRQMALTQLNNRTDLPDQLKQKIADAMVQGVQDGLKAQAPGPRESLAVAFDDLTAAMKTGMEAQHGNATLQWDVTIQKPENLRSDLARVFGISPTQAVFLEPMIQGMNQGLVNKATPNEVDLGSGRMAPASISLNGRNYDQPHFLTSGGFANIIRYQEVGSDPPRYVIMKKPMVARTEAEKLNATAETRKEAEVMHLLGDTPHAIKLEGVIKQPDNQLLMVIEYAPGGDGNGIASRKFDDNKLDQMVQNGTINQQTNTHVRTLLARDALQALATLHSNDIMSLDFKMPNMLMGQDGILKISDFGLSQTTSSSGKTQIGMEYAIGNAQPNYKAPELMTMQYENVLKINAEIFKRFGVEPLLPPPPPKPGPDASLQDVSRYTLATFRYVNGVLTPPDNPPPGSSQQVMDNHRQAVQQHAQYKELYEAVEKEFKEKGKGVEVSKSLESWNAGILINEMFHGQLPILQGINFDLQKENTLVHFSMNPANRMWVPADTPVKDLINQLMHPDPAQRISMQEALNHPVFQNALLDRPESRQLAQELFSKGVPDPTLVNLHVMSMGLHT